LYPNGAPFGQSDTGIMGIDGDSGPDHIAQRIVVDHLTLLNSTDSAMDIWGEVSDVTVSWCLIANNFHPSTLSYIPDPGQPFLLLDLGVAPRGPHPGTTNQSVIHGYLLPQEAQGLLAPGGHRLHNHVSRGGGPENPRPLRQTNARAGVTSASGNGSLRATARPFQGVQR
jgi:hypothetical protein